MITNKKLDIATIVILGILNLMLAYGLILGYVIYIAIALLITVEAWKFMRIVVVEDTIDTKTFFGYLFAAGMLFKTIGGYILISTGVIVFITISLLTAIAAAVSFLVSSKTEADNKA